MKVRVRAERVRGSGLGQPATCSVWLASERTSTSRKSLRSRVHNVPPPSPPPSPRLHRTLAARLVRVLRVGVRVGRVGVSGRGRGSYP